MNFQANSTVTHKLTSPHVNDLKYNPTIATTTRLKTCGSDSIDEQQNNKRFKRSTSKSFRQALSPTSGNYSQAGSFKMRKEDVQKQTKVADSQNTQKKIANQNVNINGNEHANTGIKLEGLNFPRDKFITQPFRQFKNKQPKQYRQFKYTPLENTKVQQYTLSDITTSQGILDRSYAETVPVRFISNHNNSGNSKNSSNTPYSSHNSQYNSSHQTVSQFNSNHTQSYANSSQHSSYNNSYNNFTSISASNIPSPLSTIRRQVSINLEKKELENVGKTTREGDGNGLNSTASDWGNNTYTSSQMSRSYKDVVDNNSGAYPNTKIYMLKNVQRVISHLPTQSSLNDYKIPRKNTSTLPITFITRSTQTDTKKVIHSISTVTVGINTQPPRQIQVKVQTDETNLSYSKNIQNNRIRIQNLEAENKKIKVEFNKIKAENTQLGKSLRQCRDREKDKQKKLQEKEKEIREKQTLIKQKQKQIQKINTITKNQPAQSSLLICPPTLSILKQSPAASYKQLSLQYLIESLKGQIQQLKHKSGIKQIQTILQSIKRQNQSLSTQLQAISLRCRFLQQQNSQLMQTEHENRRLKLEMRYLRAGMKDYRSEVERLKSENSKLREKVGQGNTAFGGNNGNGIGDSRYGQGWGSETDSLCLSVSFTRQ